jgi:hypothetical protein
MKRSQVTMDISLLRDVCGYAHWIPILNGLHLEFFEEKFPGWEWNDFVPKLLKKKILVVGNPDGAHIKLSQGLFISPYIASIDFVPDKSGAKIVVHRVKEIRHG